MRQRHGDVSSPPVDVSYRLALRSAIDTAADQQDKRFQSIIVDIPKVSNLHKVDVRKPVAVSIQTAEPLAGSDDKTCWDSLFGGVPGPRDNSSFRYMVNRTLYRPREIIQFCTEATERGRDLSLRLPLRHTAVRDAEGLYSTERARDIAAEYRYQYPGLLNVFDAFRGRHRQLDRADLEFRCLELITREVPSAGTDGWLDGCTPESLIDILWQTGFLLAETTLAGGGRRTASDGFHGSHQVRHLNVAAVRRFQIHPMFWSYLGATNSAR